MHETSKRSLPPGTLLQGYRARWKARRDTWNAFAGKPWQVDGKKRHLEHFHRKTVAGGRRRRDTWNALAGMPCQVDGGEETPGTLLREYRARWTAGKDTWNDKVRLEVNMRFKCAYWNIISSYG